MPFLWSRFSGEQLAARLRWSDQVPKSRVVAEIRSRSTSYNHTGNCAGCPSGPPGVFFFIVASKRDVPEFSQRELAAVMPSASTARSKKGRPIFSAVYHH